MTKKLRGLESGQLEYPQFDLATGLYNRGTPVTNYAINTNLTPSEETLWSGGGIVTFPKTAINMTVSSNNNADKGLLSPSGAISSEFTTDVVSSSDMVYLDANVGVVSYSVDNSSTVYIKSGVASDVDVVWGVATTVVASSDVVKVISYKINEILSVTAWLTSNGRIQSVVVNRNTDNTITVGATLKVAGSNKDSVVDFDLHYDIVRNHVIFGYIAKSKLYNVYTSVDFDTLAMTIPNNSQSFQSYIGTPVNVQIDLFEGDLTYQTLNDDGDVYWQAHHFNPSNEIYADETVPVFIVGEVAKISGFITANTKLIGQLIYTSGAIHNWFGEYEKLNTFYNIQVFGPEMFGKDGYIFKELISDATNSYNVYSIILNNTNNIEVWQLPPSNFLTGFKLLYTTTFALEGPTFNDTTAIMFSSNWVVLTNGSTVDSQNIFIVDSGNIDIGAHLVKIIGLDENWEALEELVVLEGVTPVTTSNKFIRINGMIVTKAGSAGINIGNIYIGEGVVTSGLPETVYNVISNAIYGRSSAGFFTVPKYHTLYLFQIHTSTESANPFHTNLESIDPNGLKTMLFELGSNASTVGVKLVFPYKFYQMETLHMFGKIENKDKPLTAFMSALLLDDRVANDVVDEITKDSRKAPSLYNIDINSINGVRLK